MPLRLLGLLAALTLLARLMMGLLPVAAYHDDPNESHVWGDPSFQRTWERTDSPVMDGTVQRTWIWGPTPFSTLKGEPYAESPGDLRVVQYSDKSRMEDNSWRTAVEPWNVTNGLLVVEMMDGTIQVGDAAFEPHPGGPATENVAGDTGPANGPSYATMATLRDAAPHTSGIIISTLGADGQIGFDSNYVAGGVSALDVAAPTNHTVASVFWEFMNSTGTVWVNAQFETAPLFQNPFYATGYPITEAYWSRVLVGGTERDVLLQCFERRCLTYTPANDEGWRVEAGNVGQHYYRWRYGDATGEPEPSPARLFIADLAPDIRAQPTGSDPGGRATFFLDDTGQMLHFNLSWHGLDILTSAHIHMGAPGQSGDVLYTLAMGNSSAAPRPLNTGLVESAHGQFSGDLLPPGMTLEDLLDMIADGQAYVDIHTHLLPGGALRGQIEVVEALDFVAELTNGQEVVAEPGQQPNTGASGTAWLQYRRATADLTCQIEVDGLAGVTMAHIHLGAPGGNGPPVAWLFPSGAPPPADPSLTPDGTLPCNTITSDSVDFPAASEWIFGGTSLEALVFQMLIGASYVNLHTVAFPGGEIRGQVYSEPAP